MIFFFFFFNCFASTLEELILLCSSKIRSTLYVGMWLRDSQPGAGNLPMQLALESRALVEGVSASAVQLCGWPCKRNLAHCQNLFCKQSYEKVCEMSNTWKFPWSLVALLLSAVYYPKQTSNGRDFQGKQCSLSDLYSKESHNLEPVSCYILFCFVLFLLMLFFSFRVWQVTMSVAYS